MQLSKTLEFHQAKHWFHPTIIFMISYNDSCSHYSGVYFMSGVIWQNRVSPVFILSRKMGKTVCIAQREHLSSKLIPYDRKPLKNIAYKIFHGNLSYPLVQSQLIDILALFIHKTTANQSKFYFFLPNYSLKQKIRINRTI